jgi:hypothetical protein
VSQTGPQIETRSKNIDRRWSRYRLRHIIKGEEKMKSIQENGANRKGIAIRLLYTLLNLVVLEILKLIVQVTVLFQYVYLFITRKHNEPVREFTNKVAAYNYRVMRYVTLNENRLPFPFNDFPAVIDPPESRIRF